jgi:DNA polymerase-3 subunit delta
VTPEELADELRAGRVRPAYLLAGGEPLLRDDALAALRAAVLAGGPADFNLDRLEGDEATPGQLADALRTLPMMAPRRLVWLREPASGRGAWKALAEALPGLVRGQPADAPAVLVVTAGPPDRRLAWVKAFQVEPAALVECEAPAHARELAAFARREAKRLGVSLAGDAADDLAERVGPHLLRLRSELEKAALLAGPGQPITIEHVRVGVADLAEEPVWDLTDAIGEGRAADALVVLARVLGNGAPPPVVLGALASHLRKLLRLRTGGRVAAPPFVLRKLESQARRFPPARLVAGLRALHDTDEALKGQGALDPELALERLVLNLAA